MREGPFLNVYRNSKSNLRVRRDGERRSDFNSESGIQNPLILFI